MFGVLLLKKIIAWLIEVIDHQWTTARDFYDSSLNDAHQDKNNFK